MLPKCMRAQGLAYKVSIFIHVEETSSLWNLNINYVGSTFELTLSTTAYLVIRASFLSLEH